MISICVPSVDKRINTFLIRKVFQKTNWGKISNICIKIKRDNSRSVFIYFENWNTDDNAKKIYQKLLNGEEINLVYDFPWFWKCRANLNINYLRQKILEKKVEYQKETINSLNQKITNLQDYTRWLQCFK